MTSPDTVVSTVPSRNLTPIHAGNTLAPSVAQDPDPIQEIPTREATFVDINATTRRNAIGILQRAIPLQDITSNSGQSAPTLSPHGLPETRGSIVLSKSTGLKQSAPFIADFEESIIDVILRRFGRVKSQHISSDGFEDFVRQKGEVTLANVYHKLCEKSAIAWQGILSCRALDATYFNGSLPEFFKPGDYTGSVADLFARTDQHLRHLRNNSNTAALCSIIMNEPDSQKAFSLIDLFAASAYPSSMFFALAFCAYLLHWSDCLGDTGKIVKSSLVSEEKPVILDGFTLPSRSVPVTDLFGSGFYEYTFVWACEPPGFDVVQYTTRLPYKHEPILEKIQMLAQKNDNGFWCVTLLFGNHRTFGKFESTLRSVYERLRKTIQDVSSIRNLGILHVYTVLFAIHEQINMELSAFLKQINIRARHMTVEAREHPGRSKLLHMFVLADYTLMSKYYLKTSQDRLSTLDLTGCPPAFQELKSSIQNDSKFLLVALQRTSRRLKEGQSQMRTFSEIKSAQTASIMAILVAIYVPLAGVASYLGMNTEGIINGDIDTNVFWQAAIPLMVGTILLPLSATVIARVTIAASFSTRIFTRRNWPTIVDACIASTIVAIIIAHVVNWRTRTDKYFKSFFEPISVHESIITNSILALLEMLKTLEHVFLRNKRAKKWLLLFASCWLLCTICAGVSIVDSGGIVTLATPILWIICVSAFLRPGLSALGIM